MNRLRLTRRALGSLAVALAASGIAACVPPTGGGGGGGTTTTTTTLPSTTVTVTDASLEWTISREADNASFAPGQVNYWSAGISDSTAATYVPTNGNATVLKKNASGSYVPIGSEDAVSWANRNRDGAGNVVTATNAFYLGQKIRYTGGTGTIDTASGAGTIQWTGTFTVNFYGQYVPFWIVDPTLTIDEDGSGTLQATLGGTAKDMADPEAPGTPLPSTKVTLADLPDVYGSGGSHTTGFTAATAYLGSSVTVPATPQLPKTGTNEGYWGAWPQSFVDFQTDTNLGSYWYTSGSPADPKKPQEPITVSLGF